MMKCGELGEIQFARAPVLLYHLTGYSSKGGDLASTWVTKPKVHAEVQSPRKSLCKLLVANDDNYALAA